MILFRGNSLNAKAKITKKSRSINSTTKSTTVPKATHRTSRRRVKELARRLRNMPKYKTKLYLEKEARCDGRHLHMIRRGLGIRNEG